jgi:hypothetical protein
MIDSVRSTVLTILNKNNYGVITPADFNLLAKKAQLEVVEDIMFRRNRAVNEENARMSGTGVSDKTRELAEDLERLVVFEKQLTQNGAGQSKYFLPSIATTQDILYSLQNVLCYDNSGFVGEAEKVDYRDLVRLRMADLTPPTAKYPVYVVSGDSIHVFPETYNSTNSVKATYIRHPKDPKWTYINILGGAPVFDQTINDYQDFEVPEKYHDSLVVKILKDCGVVIREAEVANYAASEEAEDQQVN